jgi:hypothetical protein
MVNKKMSRRMVLGFWMRNRKLSRIKKCKGKLRKNWPGSCRISERKEPEMERKTRKLFKTKINKPMTNKSP